MLIQLVDISTGIFNVKVLVSLSTKKIRVSQSVSRSKYTYIHVLLRMITIGAGSLDVTYLK
jgi:hypothetical protein